MTLNYRYCVGGALAWDEPSYVTRPADEQLIEAIDNYHLIRVSGPRQVGKSSLRLQATHRLQQQGYRCISIQATQLHLADEVTNESRWDSQLIALIWDSLYPTQSQAIAHWLEKTKAHTAAKRLTMFAQEILKGTVEGSLPTVIFIDEVEYLLAFPAVSKLLFNWIFSCSSSLPNSSNLASEDQQGEPGLKFVIVGSAIAADIDQYLTDQQHSEQSHTLELGNFQLHETQTLSQGFQGIVKSPTEVLKAVFCWTNGQPFLTQKLCKWAFDFLSDLSQPQTRVLRISPKALSRWVSHMVNSEVIENWRQKDHPNHLRAISDRITHSPNREALISLYQQVAVGQPIAFDNTRLQAELIISGLLITCDQQLQFNNEIYRQVFDPLLISADSTQKLAKQTLEYAEIEHVGEYINSEVSDRQRIASA